MENQKLFEEMEKFQKDLEKTNFSPRQKEILYQEKVRNLLLQSVPIVEKVEPMPKLDPRREMPDSFSSFVNRAGISQHIELVLFAVYYRIINLGEENVHVKDINTEYQLARIKSSNTSVFLNNLVKKGLLMLDGKKEGLTAFTITRDGVKYVEEKLNDGNE